MQMINGIDVWYFLSHPINIKHKYEVTNQETISLTNQLTTSRFSLLADVLTAKEENMKINLQDMKCCTLLLSQILFFLIFLFLKSRFHGRKRYPVEKVVINEGKLDGIDIDSN